MSWYHDFPYYDFAFGFDSYPYDPPPHMYDDSMTCAAFTEYYLGPPPPDQDAAVPSHQPSYCLPEISDNDTFATEWTTYPQSPTSFADATAGEPFEHCSPFVEVSPPPDNTPYECDPNINQKYSVLTTDPDLNWPGDVTYAYEHGFSSNQACTRELSTWAPTYIPFPPRSDDGHQEYESPWVYDIAAATAFHNADTAHVTPLYGTQRELDAMRSPNSLSINPDYREIYNPVNAKDVPISARLDSVASELGQFMCNCPGLCSASSPTSLSPPQCSPCPLVVGSPSIPCFTPSSFTSPSSFKFSPLTPAPPSPSLHPNPIPSFTSAPSAPCSPSMYGLYASPSPNMMIKPPCLPLRPSSSFLTPPPVPIPFPSLTSACSNPFSPSLSDLNTSPSSLKPTSLNAACDTQSIEMPKAPTRKRQLDNTEYQTQRKKPRHLEQDNFDQPPGGGLSVTFRGRRRTRRKPYRCYQYIQEQNGQCLFCGYILRDDRLDRVLDHAWSHLLRELRTYDEKFHRAGVATFITSKESLDFVRSNIPKCNQCNWKPICFRADSIGKHFDSHREAEGKSVKQYTAEDREEKRKYIASISSKMGFYNVVDYILYNILSQ